MIVPSAGASDSLCLRQDASAETSTSAVELVGYKTTWVEIRALYHEVYQQKRTPGMVLCNPEMEEEVHWEIIDLLKECLWHRQGPSLLEEEPKQSPIGTRTPRTPAQAEFHSWTQETYCWFQNKWQESCQEALRVARDAYHQVLVAAALLEGHIKRLGCSISHGQSISQWQSGTQQHLQSGGHSKSLRRCPQNGHPEQVPSVAGHTGDSTKRWGSLTQPCQAPKVSHLQRGHLSVRGSLLDPD